MEEVQFQQTDSTAVVASNSKLIPEEKVRKLRKDRSSSAFANDRKDGTSVEPVRVGGKLKSYPEFEVNILIAQEVAGASKEEKRSLVQQLMEARTERFESLVNQFKTAA